MTRSTEQEMETKSGATRAGLLSHFGNLRLAESEIRCEVEFTIVTLVVNWSRYADCLTSFAERGFTEENTEFLVFDNSEGNRSDGYSWLRATLAQARGRYIVYCHDDIEALEECGTLRNALAHLDRHDDRWMIAGNAGQRSFPKAPLFDKGKSKRTRVRYICQDRNELKCQGALPERVESLDENFFVLRRDRVPMNSIDLDGFHFHAPDLCLIAEMLGGHAYVIPFAVWHKSRGNYGEAFYAARERFGAKFARFFPGRVYRTTTTTIRMGFSQWARLYRRPAERLRHEPPMPAIMISPKR